jgi:uncharacterized protein YbjT (DUF2867 family)
MYVVIGATGHVGGATARHLLAKGEKVRVLMRTDAKRAEWEAKGAEVVLADLAVSTELADAFAGMQGAFAMTPSFLDVNDPYEENRRAVTSIVEAVHESGVEKLVFLSSIGSERDRGTGAILKTHFMEQQLMKLGIPVAAIRAASFMENYAGVIEPARETGKLPSFYQPLDRELPMIATEDIGAEAARLLTENWPGKRIVNLEGPRPYSPNDVAQVLDAVLGRPVQAEAVPETHWTSVFETWGVKPTAANMLAEMYAGFNAGLIQFQEQGTEHVKGQTELRTVLEGLVRDRVTSRG